MKKIILIIIWCFSCVLCNAQQIDIKNFNSYIKENNFKFVGGDGIKEYAISDVMEDISIHLAQLVNNKNDMIFVFNNGKTIEIYFKSVNEKCKLVYSNNNSFELRRLFIVSKETHNSKFKIERELYE